MREENAFWRVENFLSVSNIIHLCMSLTLLDTLVLKAYFWI